MCIYWTTPCRRWMLTSVNTSSPVRTHLHAPTHPNTFLRHPVSPIPPICTLFHSYFAHVHSFHSHHPTECILGALKDKTRVLVTQQVHLLHMCDLVLVLEDGKVKAFGTFEELQQSGIDIEAFVPNTANAEVTLLPAPLDLSLIPLFMTCPVTRTNTSLMHLVTISNPLVLFYLLLPFLSHCAGGGNSSHRLTRRDKE